MRHLLTFSLLVLACSCASQSSQRGPALAKSDQKIQNGLDPSLYGLDPETYVCEREHTVGSHIPETVCRYAPYQAQLRRQTQDFLRAQTNTQAAKGN